MTLYEQLKAAGVPLDHHESDLYAKRTPESDRIIAGVLMHMPRVFSVDGELWYDLPFMYDPWWDR